MATARRSTQKDSEPAVARGGAQDRLYQRIARILFDQLVSGQYKVGQRLPAERDLAEEYEVSRPVIREAMIALEVQGLIEVKIGAGAYVRMLPGSGQEPAFHVTGFELTEARLLLESEAASIAALHITDGELAELDRLVSEIALENQQDKSSDAADRAFHLLIAKASRNSLIARTIEQYWDLRSSSPECALLHRHARDADVRPVVDEHRAIANALRARDPAATRKAMREHLSKVMNDLLVATEEQAIAEARLSLASTRARFSRPAIDEVAQR